MYLLHREYCRSADVHVDLPLHIIPPMIQSTRWGSGTGVGIFARNHVSEQFATIATRSLVYKMMFAMCMAKRKRAAVTATARVFQVRIHSAAGMVAC